jgi:tetratricopeptide (TPR) repeat protein
MYLVQYFQKLSQEMPVVIFLEDIHWGDDSSLDVISRIGEFTPDYPIVIICACRPQLFERRPYWGEGQPYHTCLELRSLSKRESRQLVAEILKLANDIPAELRELVVRGAEGNPFYTEELIKMLIEDGVVIPKEDIWEIDLTRLEEVDIPSTLAGVLQARLDSLPTHEHTVLQQASVVGRLFWDRIVAYIQAEGSNGDDPELIPLALTSLRDRELVYRHEESAFVGSVEYLFKHDVLRDVTYESVIKRLRKTYHSLVADWLIANCGDRIGEYSGLIAEHFELGDRNEHACQYYLQAGEHALQSYANEEAETHFKRALSLECEKVDKSILLEGLGEALLRQDHWEEAIEVYNEVIGLNLKQANITSIPRLYVKYSRAYGFLPQSLEICLEGLKWVKDEPESHDVAMLLHETGRAYHFNGKPEQALDYCQKAYKMAMDLDDIEIQAETLATMGILSSQTPEVALDSLTRAVGLAHNGNFLRIESRALLNLGGIRQATTGDILRAREDWVRALDIAKLRGDISYEFVLLWNLLSLDFQSCELSKIESAGYSFKSFEDELPITEPPNQGFIFFKAFFMGLQGEFPRSFEILNECIDLWKKYGHLQALDALYNEIADLYFEIHWSGGAANWQEVEEVLNELIILAEKGISSHVSAMSKLSMAKTFQGNLPEANQYLETAKQVEVHYPSFERIISISKATAHLAAAEDNWEKSFSTFEDLIETFSQKGYRWEHAHTLCDWGDALVSRGDFDDFESARELYNQSLELYKDLEATWYQEQVEKRLVRITE